MSETCNNDCSSCGQECSSRRPTREEMLEPLNSYSKVKKVIGVVSGKGGVGKSLVTSYLTVALNKKGYSTAIMDADITGPSIPKAFGVHENAVGSQVGLIPCQTKNGTKIMSINLLLEDEETPVIWRGPVIAGTVKQFWSEVFWDKVDYMFVDMPPGTGDVPLTVFQSLPLDGIIIVTSPQELVSLIVAKAVNMANAMNIPILGIVENYSYIECPDCGKKISVFGESHIEEIAKKYNLPVLAQIPIDSKVAAAVDAGKIEDLEVDYFDNAVEFIESNLAVDMNEDNINVKIAVATGEDDKVYEHFGKCNNFTIFEVKNSELVANYSMGCDKTGHDAVTEALMAEKVDVVICGGIGQGAIEALLASGIQVIPGITGYVSIAAADYLSGMLEISMEANCSHKHGDDGECDCACEGCHSGGCGCS